MSQTFTKSSFSKVFFLYYSKIEFHLSYALDETKCFNVCLYTAKSWLVAERYGALLYCCLAGDTLQCEHAAFSSSESEVRKRL